MSSIHAVTESLSLYLRNWCYTTHVAVHEKKETTLKRIVILWHVTKTFSSSVESTPPMEFNKKTIIYINKFGNEPQGVNRCRLDLFSFDTELLENFLSEPNLLSFKVTITTSAYDLKDACIDHAVFEDDFKSC